MQILIATSNPGKAREITSIIQAYPNLNLDVRTLSSLNIEEPDEPFDTFMENAQHKAKYYAHKVGLPTLSEDSGLCIKALNNFPGVRSKDFVGECGGMPQAFKSLQMMLHNTDNSHAYYICAATIYLPNLAKWISYQATNQGQLSFPARGTNCFGFDPIFVPAGYDNTFAELGADIKNKIGHRGKAIRGLLEIFEELVSSKS